MVKIAVLKFNPSNLPCSNPWLEASSMTLLIPNILIFARFECSEMISKVVRLVLATLLFILIPKVPKDATGIFCSVRI